MGPDDVKAVKIYDCKYVMDCDILNTYEAVPLGKGGMPDGEKKKGTSDWNRIFSGF